MSVSKTGLRQFFLRIRQHQGDDRTDDCNSCQRQECRFTGAARHGANATDEIRTEVAAEVTHRVDQGNARSCRET